jgi:hypothetical protein
VSRRGFVAAAVRTRGALEEVSRPRSLLRGCGSERRTSPEFRFCAQKQQ